MMGEKYIVYWMFVIKCDIDGKKNDVVKGWKLFKNYDDAIVYANSLPAEAEWDIAVDYHSDKEDC